MPFPSKKKERLKKQAETMRAIKKRKRIEDQSLTITTISPDSTTVTDKNKEQEKKINLPPTTKKKTFNKELRSLSLGPKGQKKIDTRVLPPCDSGNRILHWDSLEELVESNTKCARCDSPISLKESTVGIATSVKLTCTNPTCTLNHSNKIRRTKFSKKNLRSNESFAINCQLVLGLIQMGGGSTEAGVILTFLNLPNSNAFHTKSFSRIQTKIREEIKVITDSSMEQAREEEIRKTIGEKMYEAYKKGELSPSQVSIVAMYDMGWNKRSSGNKYDSISGHGFLLGGNSKKIINYKCMSKYCRKCFAAKRTNQKIEHECPKNHEGSSKSMECEGIFRMVKEAYYKHGYTCGTIVCDDDSTMTSNLKHSLKEKVEARLITLDEWPRTKSNTLKKCNGRLPLDIPEPHFLADFNHRVKTVGKAVYTLAGLPQKDSKVTKDMASRLKLYWGAMLKQVRYLSWEREKETIRKKVLAPVEHLFNEHKYCDEKWCYVLQAQKDNKPYVPEDKKKLYCKTVDSKMYDQLNSSLERFQTDQNITECLHKYDTQTNEGLNMAVSRYVPKNKHYGTSMSLDTRVRCVIGTRNMGYSSYFKTLLRNLGCLDENDKENCPLSSGITRTDKTKLRNASDKKK